VISRFVDRGTFVVGVFTGVIHNVLFVTFSVFFVAVAAECIFVVLLAMLPSFDDMGMAISYC